jgi:hypothetical protein
MSFFTRPKIIDRYKRPGVWNLFIVNNFLPDLNKWEYTLISPTGERERVKYTDIVKNFPLRFPKVNWDRALPHCHEYGGIYFNADTGAFKAIVPNDFRY